MDSPTSKDPEIVCFRYGTCDMIITAIAVFRYGNLRTGPDGIDSRLNAIEDFNRSVEIIRDPRGFAVGIIPKTSRALHNRLDLAAGKACAG